MPISGPDREMLRRLAGELADVSSLGVHADKADLWRRLNRLQPVRPLVWINEIPWHEMGAELDLRCADQWCRGVEQGLRRVLYQWRHMPADMTVDANLWCPLAIRNSGFGLNVEAVRPEPEGAPGAGRGAVDYVPVIRSEADVEKIRMPEITHDAEATERNYHRMLDLFGDILPVRKRGWMNYWFAPWDRLICWMGIEEAMIAMIDRPAFVHAAIDRIVRAMICALDQLEARDLLDLNNCGVRVGAGGLGWTDELPQDDFDGRHVRPIDCWGNSTPQIFSEVSPEMHWEFALQYELRFLERFGLNCYGCCEPLHHKLGILGNIPRLRRISFSPRSDKAAAAEGVGTDYVFSLKPNPAVLATDVWDPQLARRALRDDLDRCRGCRVEIIMKDITTVRNEPHRLWQWSEIAMQLAEEFAA